MYVIGKKIEALMIAKGWKSKDLANNSGLSPANISRYISGKSKPGIEALTKICSALGVDLSEFNQPIIDDDLKNESFVKLAKRRTYTLTEKAWGHIDKYLKENDYLTESQIVEKCVRNFFEHELVQSTHQENFAEGSSMEEVKTTQTQKKMGTA